MELIDRYLQAVGFWLPKAQKQDIIAELSEDISSQMEEREAGLGRKLNEAEVEVILKQLGSPILVATRYLPQQHLIGPLLFPIYALVLKMSWLFYLVPWLIVWICVISFVPSQRAEDPGTLIVRGLHIIWLMAVYTFAFVTASFALVEKYHLKSGFLEKWNPRKLPPVRNPNRIKRSSSIAEIVAYVVITTWWTGLMTSATIVNNAEVRVRLAPVWHYFTWGFLLLIVAGAVLSCANLLRPHWTSLRAGIRLVSDCLSIVLWSWLCKVNIVAEITLPNVPPVKTQQITNAINLWMSRSMPVVIAIGVVIATVDVYRILRTRRRSDGAPGTLTTIAGVNS